MSRFRLIDLLVVTFVVLVATAAFLPAAEKLNEEAARKVCQSHLSMIGKAFMPGSQQVDNLKLLAVNQAIESHEVEKIGTVLRGHMTAMKQIAVGG